jgi:hypothetical protein
MSTPEPPCRHPNPSTKDYSGAASPNFDGIDRQWAPVRRGGKIHTFFSLREKYPSAARAMSQTFFSLREKYPSEAKGDEGLVNEDTLTCLAGARLSSPKA